MPTFRDHTPKRRNITRAVEKYSYHRDDLKIDFQSRCGYCNSHSSWRKADYAIDHFIPQIKDKKPFLTIKSNTDYSNLVFSCRSCNNAKSNKWPSNDENVPNRNNEGFIDPCDDNYLNQFSRKDTGEIQYSSPLGEWMYDALKLYKPQHQVIWNLEQLELAIIEIKALARNEKIKPEVSERIIQTYDKYTDYINQLKNL